jgi:cysteine-rich repeat protein
MTADERNRGRSVSVLVLGVVLAGFLAAAQSDAQYFWATRMNADGDLHNNYPSVLRLSDFTPVMSFAIHPLRASYIWRFDQARRAYLIGETGQFYDTGDGQIPVEQVALTIDTCTGAALPSVPGLTGLYAVANPSQSKIYVSDAYNNRIVVLNPVDNSISAVLTEDIDDPRRLFTAGNELYVDVTEKRGGDYISKAVVFDMDTDQHLRTIAIPWVNGRVVAVAAGRIYSEEAAGGVVRVQDAQTGDFVAGLDPMYLSDFDLGSFPLGSNQDPVVAAGKMWFMYETGIPNPDSPDFLLEKGFRYRIQALDAATHAAAYDSGWLVRPDDDRSYFKQFYLSPDTSKVYVLFPSEVSKQRVAYRTKVEVFDIASSSVINTFESPAGSGYAFAEGDPFGEYFAGLCGDGNQDAICEQCDDGNVDDGDGCDSNCTPTQCGNGIATAGEQCDDGNSNEHDACKNDCTSNVCGDGVIRIGKERCDDGNLDPDDGCEPNCELPPEVVSGNVGAGGTLTTDTEADGATVTDPVETSVTTPNAGFVSIEEGALGATQPGGFTFLGQAVHITVPLASAAQPMLVVLTVDATLLPQGANEQSVEFSKDGVLIPPCAGVPGTADPDPCVNERLLLGDGDVQVRIFSSSASEWGTVAPTHDAVVVPPKPVTLKIKRSAFIGTARGKMRVVNADARGSGSPVVKVSAITGSDCPSILRQVPDLLKEVQFAQDSRTLASGRKAMAALDLAMSRVQLTQKTVKGRRRCRVNLTAEWLVAENVDPTPDNNTAFFEIDVRDLSVFDPTDEDVSIQSLEAVKVSIAKGLDGRLMLIGIKVRNEKIGGAPRSITVSAEDGTCPPGTLSGVDFDDGSPGEQSTTVIPGGQTVTGKLTVSLSADAFTSLGRKAPSRCVGIVRADSAGDDVDPTNNETKLIIDVTDLNDL